MLGRAARRDVLGQPVRVVVVEAVGGDARRVADALHAGLGRLLEHAAASPSTFSSRVASLALRIANARCTTTSASLTRLAHAARRRSRRPGGTRSCASRARRGRTAAAPCPTIALDRARALERVDDAEAEVAGRSGHRDRQAGAWPWCGSIRLRRAPAARARDAASQPMQQVDRVGVDACRCPGAAADAVALPVARPGSCRRRRRCRSSRAPPPPVTRSSTGRCGCGRRRRRRRPRRGRRRRVTTSSPAPAAIVTSPSSELIAVVARAGVDEVAAAGWRRCGRCRSRRRGGRRRPGRTACRRRCRRARGRRRRRRRPRRCRRPRPRRSSPVPPITRSTPVAAVDLVVAGAGLEVVVRRRRRAAGRRRASP